MPDNTKVAVIKACLYEPLVNRTYAEMAADYDTAVLPARPRRPRDKAKVEAAVLIVERWLLGRLRHRRFYSLAELNSAIGDFLRQLESDNLAPVIEHQMRFEAKEPAGAGFAACRQSIKDLVTTDPVIMAHDQRRAVDVMSVLSPMRLARKKASKAHTRLVKVRKRS